MKESFNQAEELLNKIISLTSVEKFQGSSKESIEHFKKCHSEIRKKFPGFKVVTIAGTNGKGHVAYALEDLLTKNQIKCSKWCSPHLYTICERISFAGKPIAVNDLNEIVKKIEPLHKELNFSFYEFLFACFCEFVLGLEELEVLILEVGLGGRLDTTNNFDADISCLVSVGLDHTEYLGETLKEILLEKVEISRKNRPHISTVGIDYLKKIENDFVSKRGGHYQNIHDPELTYFHQNQNMVKQVFHLLYPEIKITENDVGSLSLGPGRMQEQKLGQHTLVLNGSHNPDGFKALTDYFYRESKKFDFILLGFANRTEKEINQILKIIEKYPCRFSEIKITSFQHPRALPHSEASRIAEINQIPFVNYSEFLDTIKMQNNALKVLLTGSNYFLSEVFKQLHI